MVGRLLNKALKQRPIWMFQAQLANSCKRSFVLALILGHVEGGSVQTACIKLILVKSDGFRGYMLIAEQPGGNVQVPKPPTQPDLIGGVRRRNIAQLSKMCGRLRRVDTLLERLVLRRESHGTAGGRVHAKGVTGPTVGANVRFSGRHSRPSSLQFTQCTLESIRQFDRDLLVPSISDLRYTAFDPLLRSTCTVAVGIPNTFMSACFSSRPQILSRGAV